MAKKSTPKKPAKLPWKLLIFLLFGLRVLTLLAALGGQQLLAFKDSFPYAEAVLVPFGPPLLWSWANFDGVHYIMLAQKGYVFGLTQAFFPFYPLLIRWISKILQNELITGLLISHLAFLGASAVFYKLVRLDFSQKVANKTLIVLALFPTAFYFLSLYTESIFLLFILAAFYWWRKGKTIKAGLAGMLAAATRIVGIFLVPALLFEWWQSKKRSKSQLVPVLLPVIGLGLYMRFLKNKFGDALMFAHVQEGFGAGRTTGKLVLLYQVFWRYAKMVFTVDVHNPIYFAVWLELLAAGGFLVLLAWAWYKGIRKSYLIFAFLAYLLPTLTGTFSSMPRYVLVLFPAFIVIGQLKNQWLFRFWLLISISLLLVSTALFTRGYWIA